MKKHNQKKGKTDLDLFSVKDLVNYFTEEEIKNIQSLQRENHNIAKAIKKIIQKTQNGGRIIYMGAGTSGRLGILDASECKPTFSTNLFKGIIAGGKSAITNAKENAEDNTKAGVIDLKKINFKETDVLVGLSASGETPYVLSAIKFAKKIKATTIGITTNPNSKLAKISDYKIAPTVKNEIISGSSRLKSGTAQKIILNMLSSITMIKIGKVYKNLMVDVTPRNKKLIQKYITIAIAIYYCISFEPRNHQSKESLNKARKYLSFSIESTIRYSKSFPILRSTLSNITNSSQEYGYIQTLS